MSTSITFNGASYTIPAIADASWGTNVGNYLIAIASGCLQKTGGSFTLSAADVDFGATYGLKAVYFKSKTANIASAGVLALAKTDTVGWRNNANGANLALGINGSDLLQFNSIALVDISTAQTLTNKSMSGSANTFTNMPSSSITGTLGADHGGTGVANNIASTLTISGSFATTLTITGITALTLPVSGTVAVNTNKLSFFAATTSAELAGVISDETGSGALVFANTPTLVTPVLGVATATSINKMAITAPATSSTLAVADGKTATISNTLTFTGTDSSSVAFGAGGTVAYTANKLSVFAATTSAELAGVISDETGSGALVFANTPTLVTPVLGVASATSINKVAITAPASSATLTIADGKTLTANASLTLAGTDGKTLTISNSLTFAGTDGNTMTFPSGSSTVMTLASADTITGVKTFGSTKLASPNVVVGGLTVTFPTATDTLMGKATTDVMTNKTATAMDVTAGSYINFLVQAGCRFNDDSGGDYILLQAPTGVTTYTLKLPATQGAASTNLSNDGSGNLSWAAAASATLTTGFSDIGNASNVRTATNTLLLGDISGSTVSQSYTVTNAAPGVFTVAAAPATGTKAYVTVTQNGFTLNTTYYVTNVSGTTFKLATTRANAVAGTNITSSGTTAGTILTGGFVLTSGVPGTVTNDNATAGYVGELLEAPVATDTNVGTNNQFFDAVNLTLTAGDWDVSGSIYMDRSGATFSGDFEVGIWAVTGNSSTGLKKSQNFWNYNGAFSSTFTTITASTGIVRVTSNGTDLTFAGTTAASTQIIRLKALVAYSAGQPTYQGYLRARRVR